MDIFRMAEASTMMRLRNIAANQIEAVLSSLEGVELTPESKQQLLILLGLASTGSVMNVAQGK
jgi:hypothetical protein